MKIYRGFAYLIAVEVVVQAATIAFALFGFGRWIEDGGVADKATFDEDHMNFTGASGFTFHGLNGTLIVPLLSVAFLIVSFFVRSVRGGVTWAAIVFGLVALQVALGLLGHEIVGLGPLHGINAFALFMAALYAGRRAAPQVLTPQPSPTAM
jgi:heme A synthase